MVKHKWQVGVRFIRKGSAYDGRFIIKSVDGEHILTKRNPKCLCSSWTTDYLDRNFAIINNEFLNNFS